jgi:protein-S-isoprenylcysteine O-methyltransferase Ste14
MGGLTIQKVCFAALIAGYTIWRAWETRRKQGSARGDIRLLWTFYALVILTGVVFVGTILEFCFVPREHSLVVSLVGVILFAAAHLLRLKAIRTLDKYWSLHIEIRDKQQLVQEGIYGYMRHPAYAAFILEHIAVPLFGNAWWSLSAAVFLYTPMLLIRMRLEEAALVEKFGEQYRDYQRRVGALWPRLSTLTKLGKAQQSSS